MFFMKFPLNISKYILAFSLKSLDFRAKTPNLIEYCLFVSFILTWELVQTFPVKPNRKTSYSKNILNNI